MARRGAARGTADPAVDLLLAMALGGSQPCAQVSPLFAAFRGRGHLAGESAVVRVGISPGDGVVGGSAGRAGARFTLPEPRLGDGNERAAGSVRPGARRYQGRAP